MNNLENISNINTKKFFFKNLLFVSLPVILALAFLIYTFFYFYIQNQDEKNSFELLKTLEQHKNSLEMILNDTEKQLAYMEYNQNIQLFMLTKDLFSDISFYRPIITSINNVSTPYILGSNHIDSIYFYSNKSEYVVGTKNSGPIDRFIDKEWLNKYQTSKTSKKQIYIRTVIDYERSQSTFKLITIVKPVFIGNINYGAIVFNISYDKIIELLNINNKPQQDKLFIIDSDNRILISSDSNNLGMDITQVNIPLQVIGENPISHKTNQTLFAAIKSQTSNMTYVIAKDLSTNTREIRVISLQISLMVLIGIITIIMLTIFVSLRIYTPLKTIIQIINSPTEYSDYESIKNRTIYSEYQFIINNIIKTLHSKRQMEQQLAQRLELLRKSKTIALQAQINPHFISNTLQTIGLYAFELTNSKNKVTYMIKLLSKLIRISFSTKTHLVSIREDLEHVNIRIYGRLLKKGHMVDVYIIVITMW